MRCQDCGTEGAHYRMVKAAGACCMPCWRRRDRTLRLMKVRAGINVRTDRDHHASRTLFADDPEPVRELSVADWIGGTP